MTDRLRQIKGVIFDLDGTLMHSLLDFNYLRKATGCPENLDILAYINSLDHQSQLNANKIVKDHEIEDAKQAKWIEGAHILVQHLSSLGLPVAIVTRNCREAVLHKLHGNTEYFDPVVTREDAPAKPDPEALLMIAKNWQIDVSCLAYIGDYLYDVQAANRAGMLSCLYVADSLPDYADQADVIFSDFTTFKNYFKQ